MKFLSSKEMNSEDEAFFTSVKKRTARDERSEAFSVKLKNEQREMSVASLMKFLDESRNE
jgi:hypothetical protein